MVKTADKKGKMQNTVVQSLEIEGNREGSCTSRQTLE